METNPNTELKEKDNHQLTQTPQNMDHCVDLQQLAVEINIVHSVNKSTEGGEGVECVHDLLVLANL